MWILLKEGDAYETGDQLVAFGNARPTEVYPAWAGRHRTAGDPITVRELKGWAAVVHALKTEVLGNDVEGCQTTPLFWDC